MPSRFNTISLALHNGESEPYTHHRIRGTLGAPQVPWYNWRREYSNDVLIWASGPDIGQSTSYIYAPSKSNNAKANFQLLLKGVLHATFRGVQYSLYLNDEYLHILRVMYIDSSTWYFTICRRHCFESIRRNQYILWSSDDLTGYATSGAAVWKTHLMSLALKICINPTIFVLANLSPSRSPSVCPSSPWYCRPSMEDTALQIKVTAHSLLG